MDKIDEIFYKYAVLDKGRMTEKSVKNAMLEFAKEELKKQLLLHNVSQQRELLVAYEKQHYTPNEWALVSKQCEKEIDNFLAINCG